MKTIERNGFCKSKDGIGVQIKITGMEVKIDRPRGTNFTTIRCDEQDNCPHRKQCIHSSESVEKEFKPTVAFNT